MHNFYLSEFYENIDLSVMGITVGELDNTKIKQGTIRIECDDFDDIFFNLNWIACPESEFQEIKSKLLTFKKRNGWIVGFKTSCDDDMIHQISFIDDDTDSELEKEKSISLIKEFVHENFLWEDQVLKALI